MSLSQDTLTVIDGNGETQNVVVAVTQQGYYIPYSQMTVNGSPVLTSNPVPVTMPVAPVTATPPDASVITTGGDAVQIFGPGEIVNGAYITNPINAPNGEPLFINTTGPASLTQSGANEAIYPGQTWRAAGPFTGAVWANAATSGHQFTGIRF